MTTWETRYEQAITLLCGGKCPPPDMCDRLHSGADDGGDAMQAWAANNLTLIWSMGITAMDAATLIADYPAEGSGHERGPTIIERLRRASALRGGLYADALREIERYRCDAESDTTEIERLQSEVSSLRADMTGVVGRSDHWKKCHDEDNVEIDRLSLELADLKRGLTPAGPKFDDFDF